MGIADYLMELLVSFVRSYVRLFFRTVGAALTLTLVTFVVILILMRFSQPIPQKQVSILSYFYFRYSKDGVYALVDLSKIIYLFFASLLSLGLLRFSADDQMKKEYITTGTLLKKVTGNEILLFLFTLLIASFLDYSIVLLEGTLKEVSPHLRRYIISVLFFIRIYGPLFLFSITIYKVSLGKFPVLGLSRVIMLFISFWLFNEFAYESFLFVRNYFFALVLLPFSEDQAYIMESVLGLFLMAVYIVGYYAAMTVPFKVFDQKAES